ncbi:MAG: NAD(P)H-dependent oxidoreductase subunit E [Rhodospirillales bacterium]
MNRSEPQSATQRPPHPGFGRGKSRKTPKGRQVSETSLAEVGALLRGRKLDRDLLIEHLHVIQDATGFLSAAHLAALAELMRLPMAEVYETATFYAHFDVVREDETPPPPVTIRVCDSISCEMAGAAMLQAELESAAGKDVRVLRAPCMGACDRAPVAAVGHAQVFHADAATVMRAAGQHDDPALPAYQALAEYEADGGYRVLRALKSAARDREDIISTLEDGGLRGLGGAGFPTGRKWRIVSGMSGPRVMAINADEGEPGTFKDRFCLETRPHRVLEGILIACHTVGIEDAYLYLRDEYPALHEVLRREIAAIETYGLADGVTIHLRRGAGAYLCGEESAMIESIEGKRGLPRHRPPYVAEVGLFGRPTLVNNIETLYWIPEILDRGADWWAGLGRNGGKGLRMYSVSGRVADPGVKTAPAGVTVQQLIDEFCGGMADGESFYAYLPGGASGGILPAAMGDIPLDFGHLEKHGCFTGSGAVVIMSGKDSARGAALNLMKFFEDESCGQCTPCRAGTEKAVKLMQRSDWDEDLLSELSTAMADASICGLGQAAPNPLRCVFRFFREELA